MATYTPNYNLKKPDASDEFKDFRSDYNQNMDIIDQNLGGGGGGSSTLAGLNDVTITSAQDGEVLTYDSGSSKWINGSASSSSLAGLTDVTLSTPTTGDALIYDGAEWANTPLSDVATSGDYTDLINTPTIPTNTSDLNNDSNFVADASYVHTDNNFTSAYETKLNGIEAGAEVNVQSDWSEADNTKDDFIKNKPNLATVATSGDYTDLSNTPSIPANTSDLNNDSGFTSVSWNQIQNSGTKIAEIGIDGTTTDIYAPTSGGSSGHTILNDSGTAMTDRSNLQFDDLSVTDDSVNDKTIVSASGKADKRDLTSIFLNGSNNTGSDIASDTYFYDSGVLKRATAKINNGSPVTNSNSEVVTAGGLNDLINIKSSSVTINSAYRYNYNATVIKSCKTVILKIPALTNLNANGSTILGTIPIGYRPGTTISRSTVANNSGSLIRYLLTVRQDGEFSVYNYSSYKGSESINESMTWITTE